MINVHAGDDEHEFDSATRFSTDEHNNLCVWGGRKTDELLAVFNASTWVKVGIVDDSSD